MNREDLKSKVKSYRQKNSNLAQSAPDDVAVKCKTSYLTFKECIGLTVPKGYKFTDNDRKNLFKTVQPNFKFTEIYPPTEGTESLYERIDEVHEGTKTDPIPYEGNMALVKGKFYTQNNVVYECVRDSGIAVHQPLKELIGIYAREVI